MSLSNTQKAWIDGLVKGYDEFFVRAAFIKGKRLLVIERYKANADYYKLVKLWEVPRDHSVHSIIVEVENHIRSLGKFVSEEYRPF